MEQEVSWRSSVGSIGVLSASKYHAKQYHDMIMIRYSPTLILEYMLYLIVCIVRCNLHRRHGAI